MQRRKHTTTLTAEDIDVRPQVADIIKRRTDLKYSHICIIVSRVFAQIKSD